MCTTFFGDLGDSKSGYPGAIIAAMLASEAAFVIEHPEKAKDVDAIYVAGVDGALHSYEAIHSKDASYRLPQSRQADRPYAKRLSRRAKTLS
jgi:hypothetical protein